MSVIVTLPTLHADQVRAFNLLDPTTGKRAKRALIRCGRRWGKTEYGITLAGDAAVKAQEIGWFAPDYRRVAETFSRLAEIIKPVKSRSSRTEGIIGTTTGGRIDFWTLEDESAGRSRRYHKVFVDEGAFTKPNMVGTSENPGIWDKAILPTLLDFSGSAIVFSNTNGIDPENFLYAISPEGGDPGVKPGMPGKKHGFVEYHAPSWNNPTVPARMPGETFESWTKRRAAIFAKLKADNHPLVFAQEFGAEFVDFSGVAFFELDKMLLSGQPVEWPNSCDGVFVVIDSATKTGKDNDGTAAVYFAINKTNPAAPLVVIDYEIIQIEGDLLITWLPGILANLERYAAECGARAGSLGAFIEDKDSGQILLQAAIRKGLPAQAIPSELTAIGKDERAIKASGHVHPGFVKFSRRAFEKVVAYKGTTRNHLLAQVTGFRIGDKDAAKRADDLLDAWVYGVAVALGDADGL